MMSYDDSEPTPEQIRVPTWEDLGPSVTSWKEPDLEQQQFRSRVRALRRAEVQESRRPSTSRPHRPAQPERQ
jgi:hypothetical protein